MGMISTETPLVTLGTLTLDAIPLIEEGSWGQRNVGSHASTMTFYLHGTYHLIEWDIPTLEQTEQIGLTFDADKRLEDYDGVMSLPKQAIKLIRQCGFVVPREFE